MPLSWVAINMELSGGSRHATKSRSGSEAPIGELTVRLAHHILIWLKDSKKER